MRLKERHFVIEKGGFRKLCRVIKCCLGKSREAPHGCIAQNFWTKVEGHVRYCKKKSRKKRGEIFIRPRSAMHGQIPNVYFNWPMIMTMVVTTHFISSPSPSRFHAAKSGNLRKSSEFLQHHPSS